MSSLKMQLLYIGSFLPGVQAKINSTTQRQLSSFIVLGIYNKYISGSFYLQIENGKRDNSHFAE